MTAHSSGGLRLHCVGVLEHPLRLLSRMGGFPLVWYEDWKIKGGLCLGAEIGAEAGCRSGARRTVEWTLSADRCTAIMEAYFKANLGGLEAAMQIGDRF